MSGRDEEFRRRIKNRKSRAARGLDPNAIARAAQQELRRVAREMGPSARTPPSAEERERRREAWLAAGGQRERKRRRQKRAGWLRPLAILGAAATAVVVLLAVAALGQDSWTLAPASETRPIPPQQVYTLSHAAYAAGCQLHSYRSTAADHIHVQIGIRVPYRTNPPSFGAHWPTLAPDGEYVGLGTFGVGSLVHALEHGRIEVQYAPGLGRYRTGQLEELFNQRAGTYGPAAYLLLFANTTHMPYAVSAVAWGRVLGCPDFNNRVFDAIRTFRAAYTLKGTEHAIGPE